MITGASQCVLRGVRRPEMLLDESQPEEIRKRRHGKSRALQRPEIVFAQFVDLAAELRKAANSACP
jgi:hypothetical protein